MRLATRVISVREAIPQSEKFKPKNMKQRTITQSETHKTKRHKIPKFIRKQANKRNTLVIDLFYEFLNKT